jgi:putative transcriptional regulator
MAVVKPPSPGARWTIMMGVLLGGLLAILQAGPALANGEFSPSSIAKGVFLVASPSLSDPNFHQAVILIVEHGPGGTLGLIVNRSTNVLLSKALPDLTVLKETHHRLFAGGPVEPTRLLLLCRVQEPPAEMQSVIEGVYVGAAPEVLKRIITGGKPTETFRVFAGYTGWGPGQLKGEMLQGSWAILPPDPARIFDADPSTLWTDSVSRIQAPGVISNYR